MIAHIARREKIDVARHRGRSRAVRPLTILSQML